MAALIPKMTRGTWLAFVQQLWGPMYEAVEDILGTTGTILPLGDPSQGQPDATTFTTVGAEQVTFTWSQSPDDFDIIFDPRLYSSWQGIIPFLKFNGADEEADTPDSTYWSRGDGTNDSAFSVGAWANITDSASARYLFARDDITAGNREWQFAITADDDLILVLIDASGVFAPSRTSDATIATGVWVFLAATYDGAGGASAVDTAILYVNGASVASTASNNASYVAMENGTGKTQLGFIGATPQGFLNSKLAGGPLGPFYVQKELTADEVLRLYEIGRRALAL